MAEWLRVLPGQLLEPGLEEEVLVQALSGIFVGLESHAVLHLLAIHLLAVLASSLQPASENGDNDIQYWGELGLNNGVLEAQQLG